LGRGYRARARQGLEEIIEGQMAAVVERYPDRLEADDAADRPQCPLSPHLRRSPRRGRSRTRFKRTAFATFDNGLDKQLDQQNSKC
jgi:hypothetical protein